MGGMASGEPAAGASPCEGCDARCCRSYTVHVTGADAYRIANGTGLDLVRFLAYLPQAERTDGGFLLESGGATHDLILETARTDEPRKPCLFLRVDDQTGAGRCGIYPFRPGACRRFPAVRRDGGGVALRGGIVCPDGAWAGYPLDRLSWRVALARERRDAELYAVVVADWNARVEADRGRGRRTFEQYLDHLWDAYAWIAQLRRGLPPHEGVGPALLLRVGEGLHAVPGPG
jgi:Fe-S-cluster containining protein